MDDIATFSSDLGAWRWPVIILLWGVALGLGFWMYRRRRVGRPIGSRTRGFTLIEMALVVTISGLLTVGAVKMLSGTVASARLTGTRNVLKTVEQALVVYAQQNACLPCPANGAIASGGANVGRALDAAGNTYSGCTINGCWVSAGVVPWVTLGLSESDATDGWNRRLSYHTGGLSYSGDVMDDTCGQHGTTVTLERNRGFVLETIAQTIPPNRVCAPEGSVQINDASGGELTGGAGNRAVYVLISHGPDSYGGWASNGAQSLGGNSNANQDVNKGDAGPFVQDSYSAVPGPTYFDDVVLWRSGGIAVAKCGTGLCGNPD